MFWLRLGDEREYIIVVLIILRVRLACLCLGRRLPPPPWLGWWWWWIIIIVIVVVGVIWTWYLDLDVIWLAEVLSEMYFGMVMGLAE